MRIVGRSQSPSFPPLETLLPMEKSWALEVEREEEALCLQGKSERPDRVTESAKQIEGSWVSCKRLNSGSREASHRSHEREHELCGERASRSFDSKPYRDDRHTDSSRNSEETRTAWQFTSSSRCYPPSVRSRSLEPSISPERRASRLPTQSALHAARKFSKPNRMHWRDLTPAKNGSFRKSQGVKLSANTLERRQDHFACLNHRQAAGTSSVYNASKKHRDHQKLDECMHGFQPLFNKNSQNRHVQYCVKSRFSSHSHTIKKMGYQAPCHGVTDWKNAKKCGRTTESELRQHVEAILAVQSFEEKAEMTNDENIAPEAVFTTENACSEGIGMLESSCTEGSEVKKDDSTVAKQYKMLASLLLDHDIDVTLVGEGPDCEYSGSIFDDELEASMDIDVVTEDKEAMSGKVPAACITKHPECSSGSASAVKSSASQRARKLHDPYTSSGLRQSPSVLIDVTNKFDIHTPPRVQGEEQEGDAHRLSQRQRQIEFGKNTLGYERYSELIPRIKRKAKDPQTPNPKQVCSKRSWDGQIRKWRRLLHAYDPPSEDEEEIAEDFSILKLHRSSIEEKGPDASLDLRDAESEESKGCVVGKSMGDANFTIYDDWMES